MTWYVAATLAVTSVGLASCLVFCIGYWIFSKGTWWRSEHGRFLMLFMGCLGTLFALIISSRVFGDWPGRQIVSLVLYLSYVVVSLWPVRLLWISFRRSKAIPLVERKGDNI